MEESEQIDKFLRGELDEEQRQRFLRDVEADAALKRKVSLRKLVIDGISAAYAEKLKKELAAFDKTLEGKKRFQFSWKVAAVFAVFILTGAIAYIQLAQVSPYDFDIADPGLPNEMGMSHDIEFARAMNSFKTNDFKRAGESFEYLLKQNPANDTLLYYLGICQFRNGNIEQAIEDWNQVREQSTFIGKTKYRLAIAYWIKGNDEQAYELLHAVSKDEKNPYQRKALEALDAFD